MCDCDDDEPYVPNENTFSIPVEVWRNLNMGISETAPEKARAFIQFSGDPAYTRDLSRLLKYFLEGSMYRVEYLTKLDESTTLKVFEDD